MFDIKFIRQYPDKVKKAAKDKGIVVDIDKLLKLDEKRRGLQTELDDLRASQKKTEDRKKAKEIKGQIQSRKKEQDKIEKEYLDLLWKIPNIPSDDVKVGKDESDNEVIKTEGPKTEFDFKPKNHLEIGESLDVIDVKRAAKVSGSRFGYLKNQAVLLQFALVNYVFDLLTQEGFKPILPPAMVNGESMKGMGYLEHGGQDETYYFEKDDLYFVGTSEQSIGPMFKDEILSENDLPLRFVGFSSCFRREAGSYGKDVKGILRVHQFDKAEMFSYTKPEDSDKEHEYLLSLEEKITQALELPYQVVKMCTGDLGNPAARKYDIEVWLPGQNKYRETHSTSSCTDFQARRLNIRYKDKETKKNQFVHTLNGTAVALGRIIIAILENYQQKDGSVQIPKALQKYLSFKEIK